jgi:peptidoglycan/LPS O-acetylase OafA/YrhL
MPILIRASAILLVTAGHFGLLAYGGGATSILMLVSGYLLGGLALQEAFARREAAPVLKTVANILVPTLALSVGLWLFRLPGRQPEPYILLLTADLQDYDANHNAQDLYLWFVHCLLHMMLLVYLALGALKLVGGFRIGIRRFLWGIFAVALVGRFLLPWALDPQFFVPGHHRDLVYLLPTTHLATLALGGLAATATERRQRLALGAVIVAYAAASGWCFGPNQGAFLLVGGLLLTAAPRLRLPNLIAPAVLSVAAASLWIYLTHMIVRDGLRRLHLDQPVIGLALALAIGVGVWFVWRRGLQWASRLLRRPAPLVADAV